MNKKVFGSVKLKARKLKNFILPLFLFWDISSGVNSVLGIFFFFSWRSLRQYEDGQLFLLPKSNKLSKEKQD
jgi:hypothetical protein